MAPTVVLTNDLGQVKSQLRDATGLVRFIDLTGGSESLGILVYLRELPGSEELAKSQLLRNNRDEFRGKYVEFLGKINARNHNLEWWAMLFTDKNPIFPGLYRNASYALLIVELMRDQEDTLVVISDSDDLLAQIKDWGRSSGVRVRGSISTAISWRSIVKSKTPLPFAYALWRAALYSLLSRKLRPQRNQNDELLVVTTLSHPGSFARDGEYRDAYFGPWLDQLKDSDKKTLVFALAVEQPRTQLKKIKQLRSGPTVIPMDACLTLLGLTACFFRAALRYVRPVKLKGPAEIDGVNLSCLVQRTINGDSRSGNYLMALRVYYCARHLARTVNIPRCVYPYENLSWEKMLLLGIREVAPETDIVGYQHSSITVNHTTLLLQKEESQAQPLPDEILTTGKVTKTWLEEMGNYPDGMFTAACALRQNTSLPQALRERPARVRRLLVALGTSRQEYVQVLVLLEKAFGAGTGPHGYEIRVRPHPLISLEPALSVAPLADQDFFTVSSGPLEPEMEWADVVLYASSTVGLEAVSMDIPAVFLDVDDLLETDPMFGWTDLKWTATGPSELIEALRAIEGISDDRFQTLQQKGREYSADYLSPISESALAPFEGQPSGTGTNRHASPELSHSSIK